MGVTAIHHTESLELKLRDDGIIEIRCRPEMTGYFELHHMQENVEMIQRINTDHHLILVHIINGKYTLEARKFLASQNDLANKVAMVAKSPYQKLIGNFFLGLYRPQLTIKLFNSGKKAEEWLKENQD